MFGFKKPQRRLNQQRRRVKVNEDDEDEDGEQQQQQSEISAIKEKQSKRSNNKTMLSFHDEAEDESEGQVFKVKKSSTSRRLIKEKKKKEKEEKRRLKMGVSPDNDDDDDDVDGDGNGDQSWVLTGKEAEALHLEEEDNLPDNYKSDENSDNDDDRKETDSLRAIFKSGAIPDAAAIHAARKKRQLAREKGVQDDFIPVNSNKVGSSRSRKQRLSESEEDEDLEHGRMTLTGVKSLEKDRELSRLDMKNEVYDLEDDEEENGGKNNGNHHQHYYHPQQQHQLQQANNEPSIPLQKLSIYDLNGIKSRVKERLEGLQEVHRRHRQDADRACDDLIESRTQIEALQEDVVPGLTSRHRYYQELRGYVTDLLECFDEKIVNIQYLEDKLYKSKQSTCDKLMERRREDVRDQMAELSGKIVDQQQQSAAEAQRQRRAAEREGRRRRRFQQRIHKKVLNHNEGMSSDDEMPTLDKANISKTMQDIENQARGVLSDVVEEFSTVTGVKNRMESWKKEDPDSYNDAYVSLCLPKLFSPLVRLQILFWNPTADGRSIEDMNFFVQLAQFEMNPELGKDPDRKLLSLIIEKVVIPKAAALIKCSYDPMSSSQTQKLTNLVKKVIEEYPTVTGDSKQVRMMLEAVRDKLKNCIEHDPYIPIGYNKQMKESPNGGHSLFAHRQFWSCFKLFQNILLWQGVLSDSIVADLALNSLLNRYLIIALGMMSSANVDVTSKVKIIASVLPTEWVKKRPLMTELGAFVRYLDSLCKALMKSGAGRDAVLGVIDILRFIGASNEADINRKLIKS